MTSSAISELKLNWGWDQAAAELGMIENEPIEQYHATQAISKSKLDDFCPPEGRPSFFFRKHLLRVVEEPKKRHYEIGNAAGAMLLEGSAVFNERYAVERPWGRRKIEREAKAAYEAEANAKGKIWLTQPEGELMQAMVCAVQQCDLASELLRCGKPETTWRLRLPEFMVQCRTDWFIEEASIELASMCPFIEVGEPVMVDLKTCGTLAEDGKASIHRNIRDYGYYKQHAFYREVVGAVRKSMGLRAPRTMLFIAVEKSEPFEAAVFHCDPADVDQGTEQIVSSLGLLRQCFRTGYWPGAAKRESVMVSLKPWDKKKIESVMLGESASRMALQEKAGA